MIVRGELRDAEVKHARKLAEKKLWEEHAFRHAIETSVPSGIAVVNLEGKQTYVNPAFCEMVGWTEAELIGSKPPFVYWPPEDVDKITSILTQAINGESPDGFELRFRRLTQPLDRVREPGIGRVFDVLHKIRFVFRVAAYECKRVLSVQQSLAEVRFFGERRTSG